MYSMYIVLYDLNRSLDNIDDKCRHEHRKRAEWFCGISLLQVTHTYTHNKNNNIIGNTTSKQYTNSTHVVLVHRRRILEWNAYNVWRLHKTGSHVLTVLYYLCCNRWAVGSTVQNVVRWWHEGDVVLSFATERQTPLSTTRPRRRSSTVGAMTTKPMTVSMLFVVYN